jgi:hypothetical protein
MFFFMLVIRETLFFDLKLWAFMCTLLLPLLFYVVFVITLSSTLIAYIYGVLQKWQSFFIKAEV